VTERLRIRGVDPASAEWDAWRRDDGRWAVRVSYFAEENAELVAMFAYDAPGRYAVPDDDEARWLVGEQVQVIAPQPTSERRLTAVADFDLSLAPDHGADSYEAGFEDTISLPRGRAAQADRDANRDTGRGFGRDPEYGTARDVERGPRRVHSVPSPDEEPTLIDVPIEPPPTLRPAVRAVERPAQLPVEAPTMSPPEERAAAPENRFTERRMPPPETRRPEQFQPAPEPRQPEPRQHESRQPESRQPEPRQQEVRQQEVRRQEPAARPADPRPADVRPKPADPRPAAPKPVAPKPAEPQREPEPAAEQTPAAAEPAAEAAPTAEEKKKPAKRGSKRASVPSWDEIMFGKKAD
jgi:hypothetical protein